MVSAIAKLNASLVVGALLLMAISLAALLATVFYPDDPLAMVSQPFLRPGEEQGFWLGTDMLGRDLAAQLFYGARVSLLIGFVAALFSVVIGVILGALAGYYGGHIDTLISRVCEFFQALPSFIFTLILVAVLQPTVWTIVFAIGITSWPSLARLVRAEVFKLRHGELVQASINLGGSDFRIIAMHLLPNMLPPIFITGSLMVAHAILTESSLAFLGLGDQNIASWGGMIGAGRSVLRTDWYISVVPGLGIVTVVLALNLLSDGLSQLMSPRARR
ncbi:ABC transporter permease [Pseudomonas helleri]|uniref:ABC transporter permease n=1 Tax=Pseudomonas helleri TaxID=1608996 RepID=UPI00333E8D1C